MSIVDTVDRKRQGIGNTEAELEALVRGYLRGDVPDYQVAAWLMAVCFQGMAADELSAFTRLLARSGRQLDLSSLGCPVADKHSTGGVGDKTSLVVVPLVAACGVPVGKMSGRALGFTGGTIDKLESIPGLRVELSADEFVSQLHEVGLVISGQSADLAPADGKLYALRDATATVASIPLIAASVMSKKLAGGAECIVLDVKVGRGAFMASVEDARELARRMIGLGRQAGRRMAAFVTDMSQPLGRAVGNSLEVQEAIATLGDQGPADLRQLAVAIAAEMVGLATGEPEADVSARVENALASGAGLDAFARLVRAQGGEAAVIDETALLPRAAIVEALPSPRSGFIQGVDGLLIAQAAGALGASRLRKGDPIDPAVGVVLETRVGDQVEQGQPLARVHANDQALLANARQLLAQAFEITESEVLPPALIHAHLTEA